MKKKRLPKKSESMISAWRIDKVSDYFSKKMLDKK